MADDRRIIFSSYLMGKRASSAEEDIVTKWAIHPDINKSLGGKGIVTNMNLTQPYTGDGWTSMYHENMTWGDLDDDWEVAADYWTGLAEVTTSPIEVNSSGVDLSFAYFKNTGDYDLNISLDGGGAFPILIPPGGSVNLRGNGSVVKCNYVYAKTLTNSTTMEFIIAAK